MNSALTTPPATDDEPTISRAGRWIVLLVAMLGWGSSGFQLAITSLIGEKAAMNLLDGVDGYSAARHSAEIRQFKAWRKPPDFSKASPEFEAFTQYENDNSLTGRWFAWFQASMLFGGASGGLLFGWLGDRFGRRRGLTVSILMSSIMAIICYFTQTPSQLCVCWFLSCLGLGGMWPNGVAIISESWSGISRSTVSGVMGAAANVGILLMSTIAKFPAFEVTYENWRQILFFAGSPLVLGIIAVFLLPESPRWLKLHRRSERSEADAATVVKPAGMSEIFRGALLPITLMTIVLATVPTMGGWGTANWMVPWAGKLGSPNLPAQVIQYRSLTGIVGSMIGGWLAVRYGRRLIYFLTSFGCLCSAQITFWFVLPTDAAFLPLVATLGFFSGIYFGWLPQCMPEFFPTRNRSAGAGVSFNFGRIFTAVTVFTVGSFMALFKGDYALIGRITSLVFLVGMIVIWFAPISKQAELKD